MPENLRVTTPLPSNGRVEKERAIKQNPLQDIGSADRSAPPVIQGTAGENLKLNLLMNEYSALSKFIQDLQKAPSLGDSVMNLLFSASAKTSQETAAENASSVIVQFMNAAVPADKGELVSNLLFQQKNSTRFSGPLFQFFNNLNNDAQDEGLENKLVSFLKAYDGYFSMPDTVDAIKRNMEAIRDHIPQLYSSKLSDLAEKLTPGQSSEIKSENISVLTGEIIPFLSEYVHETNDLGKARTYIALLMHNTARLNLCSKEELVESFEDLLQYCKYRFRLNNENLHMIRALFSGEVSREREDNKNQFIDTLASLLSGNDSGSRGGIVRSAVKDACSSLLMDRSVFMPYTHLFMPIKNGDDLAAFSEIWIEKKDKEQKKPDAAALPLRLLISLDVRDLGTFEASIELLEKNVRLRLSCPAGFSSKSRELSQDISGIFSRNGLTVKNISVEDSPLNISRIIIDKVTERRYGLNVSV
ncbi:MAG: hypothetical protein Q8878_02480 [Bacillota bacterium]|nr:hypothetical protein [Bacillota bacterium]